jgi:hypothetical protein
MKVFFDDSEFDAQFARTVGKSVSAWPTSASALLRPAA